MHRDTCIVISIVLWGSWPYAAIVYLCVYQIACVHILWTRVERPPEFPLTVVPLTLIVTLLKPSQTLSLYRSSYWPLSPPNMTYIKSFAPSCDPCPYTHTNKHIYILSASCCKSQGSNMAQGVVVYILLYKTNSELLVNFSQGACLHVQYLHW